MAGDGKLKYKEFCEQRTDVPLFMQYWWMEVVCAGKRWDVALAYDGDKIAGAMPYHYGRKLGMTYIIQPQLTQYSGPFYCYPPDMDRGQRYDFETCVARKLMEQIESRRPAFFLQNFSPRVTNWLPFYWAGFKQTTRYTYRIGDISDLDKVFGSFDPEKRQRKINRYKDSTSVRFDMRPSDFAAFHAAYWNGKGKKDQLPRPFIERVCSTAIERGNGVIASLHDGDGRLLAARFVAYDANCAYALMSAVDLELHRSGHNETLIWGLLQYLSGKSRAFDFEGSMDEGIEYFYRSFGTEQTPFFEITKCNSRLFALLLKIRKR